VFLAPSFVFLDENVTEIKYIFLTIFGQPKFKGERQLLSCSLCSFFFPGDDATVSMTLMSLARFWRPCRERHQTSKAYRQI